MRLKLYCNRYKHFKDSLVCAVNCTYRTRCHDFALFYDKNREATDKIVDDYYSARRNSSAPSAASAVSAKSGARPVTRLSATTVVEMRSLVSLEVKRVMSEVTYIWIGKEDQAEVLEHEEVIRRAERGEQPKSVYKVAQEMELRFQLVPRRAVEKAKRQAANEAAIADARAAARRPRPQLVEDDDEGDAPSVTTATPAARTDAPPRARAQRLARASGGK